MSKRDNNQVRIDPEFKKLLKDIMNAQVKNGVINATDVSYPKVTRDIAHSPISEELKEQLSKKRVDDIKFKLKTDKNRLWN